MFTLALSAVVQREVCSVQRPGGLGPAQCRPVSLWRPGFSALSGPRGAWAMRRLGTSPSGANGSVVPSPVVWDAHGWCRVTQLELVTCLVLFVEDSLWFFPVE